MSTAEPGRVPDPAAIFETWMRWEKGEVTPGQTLADLKKRGLRDLLDQWAAAQQAAAEEISGS